MGIGFVIIIHLIVIFVLSFIIAIIGAITIYFLSKNNKRKRKTILALILPFIGLYTLYFSCLMGSIMISETKNIDIGIGDTSYIPLDENHQLLFIDLPEHAFIEKDGQTVISGVSKMEQTEKHVLGTTYDNKYFSYNLKTNKLKKFESKKELEIYKIEKELNLKKAIEFYSEKRNEIAGFHLIIVGIFSLLISIITLILITKLVLGKIKLKRIKTNANTV
ncbi:hypothetical protein [uncultured Polaribacter sp.]|uniref:hypothetical protein n=1 Tax=uncultured Polaribacter sp. TaxID=174711 RepID=UPI0026059563|nr:hypothetical protein [uncultured Polaribacter sp.]